MVHTSFVVKYNLMNSFKTLIYYTDVFLVYNISLTYSRIIKCKNEFVCKISLQIMWIYLKNAG